MVSSVPFLVHCHGGHWWSVGSVVQQPQPATDSVPHETRLQKEFDIQVSGRREREWKEGGMEGGRRREGEGGREGGREGEREGGKKAYKQMTVLCVCTHARVLMCMSDSHPGWHRPQPVVC